MPLSLPHAFVKRHAWIALTGLALGPQAVADEPTQVVASFSVLADMVRNVGGDRVEVTSLVGPDSDPHVYSPRPTDARALAEADLVVLNGLQFEGWMTRLLDASGYQGKTVVATDGVPLLAYGGQSLHRQKEEGAEHDHEEHDGHDHDSHEEHDGHDHGSHEEHDGHDGHEEHDSHDGHDGHDDHDSHDHGEYDPHAWLDLSAGLIYVANIRDGLIAVDPDNSEHYASRADSYMEDIQAAHDQVLALLDDLPEHAQVIVGHDAFGHFSRAYGIDFLSPVGLSTEAEPSAADIARMVDVIRERQIPALFVENMSSPALMEQLSEETGVPIAGSLYNGALSEEGMTSHYLGMILHNAEVLHQGLVDAEGHDDSHDGHDHDHDHDHDH
ncbi:zinc ABC transporter substrate-binding protein [Halomonas sp.]|uniref:metal ABC transporter solute-binding protein, Zn/Mn family n=2 Tax=unclassified Halomonas TaxID=2609666 RepID=UPI000C900B31|nr:zinc ABC transporter substrate-binding protein [Halomonas sp.]MAR73558.1 metal ABC transporter substrate-binding protein [Halomonas sp.]MBR9881908.1 zinc ABC transporter solute-binding protein [Gammaproteobacteria bacterium]|tara:strand:+ start:7009 stop:8163 length:1155 start_codon:yes stop_codon:yes gene_type:complete